MEKPVKWSNRERKNKSKPKLKDRVGRKVQNGEGEIG